MLQRFQKKKHAAQKVKKGDFYTLLHVRCNSLFSILKATGNSSLKWINVYKLSTFPKSKLVHLTTKSSIFLYAYIYVPTATSKWIEEQDDSINHATLPLMHTTSLNHNHTTFHHTFTLRKMQSTWQRSLTPNQKRIWQPNQTLFMGSKQQWLLQRQMEGCLMRLRPSRQPWSRRPQPP